MMGTKLQGQFERPKLTPRQRMIWEQLSQKSKDMADIFLGAMMTYQYTENPDRLSQTAHALRELLNHLIRYYNVPKPARDSTEAKTRNSQAVRLREMLRITDKAGGGLPPELAKREAQRWNRCHEWFQKICHRQIKPTEEEFSRRLDEWELLLSSFINPYFFTTTELDALIKESNPSTEHITTLEALFKKRGHLDYFFKHVENPRWLTLLWDAGYFDEPTPPLIEEQGTRFPYWVEAQYLLKIADQLPNEVLNVILLAPKTENLNVIDSFTGMTLKMPAQIAKGIIPKVKNIWIRNRFLRAGFIPIPKKLADLIVKLAQGGETQAAFELAEIVFDVRIRKPKEATEMNTFIDTKPDAESYIDNWNYREAIKQVGPVLQEIDGLKYCRFLGDKLAKAIKLENGVRNITDFDIDYSSIWCPSIANPEKEDYWYVKEILLQAFREALLNLWKRGREDQLQALDLLNSYHYPVFRRMTIFLLMLTPTDYQDRVKAIIMDHRNLESFDVRYEFKTLLKEFFPQMDEDGQNEFLALIEKGPDLERIKTGQRKTRSTQHSIEELEQHKELCQYSWLGPIRAHLPEPYKTLYTRLAFKFGDQEEEVEPRKHTTWVGPTSPLSQEEIDRMSPQQVIKYLVSWVPPSGFMVPNPEGLGRLIALDIEKRIADYVPLALFMFEKKLRPVYLYYFFHALEQKLKEKVDLNWDSILNLCEKVVFAHSLPEPPKDTFDYETGWRGVKKEIASVLGAGLVHPHYNIPFGFRERVWRIIEMLCQEPEPDLAYEQQYGGSNIDPVTMSINTTRGEAVHAVMRYAMWCDHYAKLDLPEDKQTHEIPAEVKTVLEKLLNSELEPTQTIRSIYGWYLQSLCFLELKWVDRNLNKILPSDPELIRLRNAALEGYFSFSHPSGPMYQNLRPLFEMAIEWAAEQNGSGSSHLRPKHNFAGYLMNIYWWGLEPLNGEQSLIKRFFGKATPNITASGVEHIGRSLEYLRSNIPGGPECMMRLSNLWDWRLLEISNANDKAIYQEELKNIGWWFQYGDFEHKWLIDALLQTLHLSGGKIDIEDDVLERLTEFVSSCPVETSRAVNLIVRGDKEGWSIDYWAPNLRSIFQELKKSSSPIAIQQMNDTINYLGERGYYGFRDLL